MTKWARIRKRKEKRKAVQETKSSVVEENEIKLAEPEKTSRNIKHSEEVTKSDTTKIFKANTILAQIPRYVYLAGFFALLVGIFSPITVHPLLAGYVIQGIAILALGLSGIILLVRSLTLDKRREIVGAIGLSLTAISLALIFHLMLMLQELMSIG